MKIGLIDVDGHHYPNLALMRISAYHKTLGDTVEWWWGFGHYDIVYMSKVFSAEYSPDVDEPLNADLVIKGGTGYAISLVDGIEVYDKDKDPSLPPEMECMTPDYSIYPQYDFAVCMTSRGCPRGCPWCHVGAKEGKCSCKVADTGEMWSKQKRIHCLDPNITACPDKRDLFRQYKETGALLQFNQGLDIRLLDDDDIADLNTMRLESLHFAWDCPSDNLTEYFVRFKEKFTKSMRHIPSVYCMTNFEKCSVEEHIERELFRIYTLRDIGLDPYVMIYNKPHADKRIKRLQGWCNNKRIFRTCPDFADYAR